LSLADKFSDFLPTGHGAQAAGSAHVDTVSAHAPADAIIIPDANLLFTGDFKRSGIDLVLSKDDRELVLHDYFKGEKRAALASPDGAHLTPEIVNALAGHVQLAQADGTATAAQVIGHVTKLVGTATAIRNGVSIILNQGDNVYKGDVVQSGSDSTLGLTFIDGTVFGLAQNAKMVLNEMIYDPNGSNNSSLMSLVQGTISFVAGATAKHGDMKVDTPVATMGIRGTAVLVEVDFEVPGQGSAPPAKFQVLVEPDGTSGSYILFDKTTLTPIATVNQPGTQTIISGGNVSFLSSAQLSADAQKIITDVFALKFTDNSNPNTKLTTNFTDSIVPVTFGLKLWDGTVITATAQYFVQADRPPPAPGGNREKSGDHIPGPPTVVTLSAAFTERDGLTHNSTPDTVSNQIRWADINAGDTPSATAKFDSFSYKDAHNNDVTASLTAEQLAAIKAVEIPLQVVQDPGNKNTGTATWTYSLPDDAFDFLAAGETLTLTYMARVDNNFALNNEFTFMPLTVTITGTNNVPTIATAGGTIVERIGTGNTALDTVSGTVTFTDVDLTDRPVVSASLSSSHPYVYLDAQGHDVTASLTAEQKAAIAAVEIPLSVVQAAGNGHNGSATWTYSIADHAFDFIAKGETLILNYVATVDDGHGGVISTPISVSINPDVVVDGTNDVPVITSGPQTGALIELIDTRSASTPDEAQGTITFTDADLTDTHAVTVEGVGISGVTSGLADPATVLGWLSLGVLTDSTNGVTGSRDWTFSAADKSFDYLAAGEPLTLIYTIQVDDHHGGVVTQPVTITITGSNDAPVVAADVSGALGTGLHGITERVGTTGDSADNDTTGGSLAFSDVDLSDTHTDSQAAPVFHWSDANHNPLTLTPSQESALTAASHLALTLHDSTTTGHGSVDFAYSAADSSFDFLAAGETLTITYDVAVTDNNHVSSTKPVTITVTGTNDAPTLADVIAGTLADTSIDDSFPDLTGTLVGKDIDSGETASLTYAALDATSQPITTVVGQYGTLTVHLDGTYDYVADAAAINGLRDGAHADVFTVQTTDVHGATGTATLTVNVTGSNDTPSIVSETDPLTQAVIVVDPVQPIVLAQGLNTNSLGLSTETFDHLPDGSDLAHGNFQSIALDATFSGTGHTGIINESIPGVGVAVFVGPLPGSLDATNYLSISAGGVETITFASEKNAFGLYWGSVDPFNSIKFYDGATLVASYTGADVIPLLSGNQGAFTANGYVQFSGLHAFDKVVLDTGNSDAFEIENISAGCVPERHASLATPISGTLSVHDADIGDTLTPSVTGNATIEYNGSTTLPNGVDVAALIDAGDITFDTVQTNGGTQTLHWSYNSIDPNLDFLHSGDVLTIKFTAQVNDGHGNVGSQPLTITIAGTDTSQDISAFNVVNGTTGDETFTHVGGNVTIFGGGGQDSFVFNPGFLSATIGDFDVNNGRINISQTLFSCVADILAAATPANSNHDTVITDAAHDTITLKGVTVAQLQESNFHLI